MLTFKPLYNKILVKPNEVNLKTKSGIFVSETQNLRAVTVQTGLVVEIGDGMITPDGGLVPLQVQVGDTVYFRRGSEEIVKLAPDEEPLFMFKEVDLLGIEPRDPAEQSIFGAARRVLAENN